MSATTTAFGIPITGEEPIFGRRGSKEQRPIEDLEGPIRAALEVPNVTGIRWLQYTPYFNDGDVCEFGVNGAYFEFTDTVVGEDEDYGQGDYEDGFLSAWDLSRGPGHYEDRIKPHPKAGQPVSNWDKWHHPSGFYPQTHQVSEWVSDGPPREGIDILQALDKLISSGHYEDALYQAFGDHAKVTVRKDKIEIDFYEHD